MTPVLLARFGLGSTYFVDGQALMKLRLTQTGSPEFAFDVDVDLGPARLEIANFGWVKATGGAGRLEAAGRYGEGIRISRFRLDTGEPTVAGAAHFGPEGRVRNARRDALAFRGGVVVGVFRPVAVFAGDADRLGDQRALLFQPLELFLKSGQPLGGHRYFFHQQASWQT